jgi:hypothetical protein
VGFNSGILVLNDRISEIERSPDHFVKGMVQAIHKSASHNEPHGTEFYVGQSSVICCAHADMTQLVAIGGNCSTILGNFWGHEHHTEAGQERILRSLADRLGFRLVRKTERKPR